MSSSGRASISLDFASSPVLGCCRCVLNNLWWKIPPLKERLWGLASLG